VEEVAELEMAEVEQELVDLELHFLVEQN